MLQSKDREKINLLANHMCTIEVNASKHHHTQTHLSYTYSLFLGEDLAGCCLRPVSLPLADNFGDRCNLGESFFTVVLTGGWVLASSSDSLSVSSPSTTVPCKGNDFLAAFKIGLLSELGITSLASILDRNSSVSSLIISKS